MNWQTIDSNKLIFIRNDSLDEICYEILKNIKLENKQMLFYTDLKTKLRTPKNEL